MAFCSEKPFLTTKPISEKGELVWRVRGVGEYYLEMISHHTLLLITLT